LHQHQQLTRVRYKKERQNQHILSTSVCTKNLEISLILVRLSKSPLRTFFRAKTLSFVVSFFLSKDKNHHASSDFIVDDGAKE
jgi:hypothetical protein